MFDTITIRIHKLKKYPDLVKLLFDPNSGSKRYAIVLDKALDAAYQATTNKRLFIDYLDKKNLIEFDYRKKIKLTQSSNYEFQYMQNTTRDYLEFQFSIPKFLYGTNVLQGLYHKAGIAEAPNMKDFNPYNWEEKDDTMNRLGNMEWAFTWLKNFIEKKFFGFMFPFIAVDFRDVSIARLDICFNQVFKTKEAAVEYLSYQRNIKKKYARDNSNYVRDWRTSITYVGSLFSAKIYLKGPEFQKKDKRQLNRINDDLKKEGKRKKFDTKVLQDLADRTLRYELTCHSKMFSYIYFSELYGKGNWHWFKQKKRFNELRSQLNKVSPDGKVIGYMAFTTGDKEFYKDFSKKLSKRVLFMLEGENTLDTAVFDEQLVTVLVKRLKSFFDEFQVEDRPEQLGVIEDLEAYNQGVRKHHLQDVTTDKIVKQLKLKQIFEENPQKKQQIKDNIRKRGKKGLHLSSMRGFLSHLYHYGSHTEMINSGLYSRRYVDRMAERFKKIGFDIKAPKADVKQLYIDKTFRGYHEFVLFNYRSLSSHFTYEM